MRNLNPRDYIPKFYRKKAYEACYQYIIHLTNGDKVLDITQFTNMQPPPPKNVSGRPKKSRREEVGEISSNNANMMNKKLTERVL